MAQSVVKGINSVPGAEAVLLQVPEILPEEVLAKMGAPPKPDVPIAKVEDLPSYDGIIWGVPTRYGSPAAQMKAFWDATGGLWASGALAGKPTAIFVSTGTQGGGQETTALTAMGNFVHHGMVFVPNGYTFGAGLFSVDEVRGGSPWGAGTFAGATGGRMPSDLELEIAEHQGKYFTGVAQKLAA